MVGRGKVLASPEVPFGHVSAEGSLMSQLLSRKALLGGPWVRAAPPAGLAELGSSWPREEGELLSAVWRATERLSSKDDLQPACHRIFKFCPKQSNLSVNSKRYCCAAQRIAFLHAVFLPQKSSPDINLFHLVLNSLYSTLLMIPICTGCFHCSVSFRTQAGEAQYYVVEPGGFWSPIRDSGAARWDPAAAEAFSKRVEASLLHPSSFWQGQQRNCTGRLTARTHISCSVIPAGCLTLR